jgi:hypothetical protein
MGAIADIFRTYGPAYLERFGDRMPAEHRKALEAIMHCRTGAYGTVGYVCEHCGRKHLVPRSCGNRHCPTCQNHKTRHWLHQRLQQALPGHHFLITFTVPQELRRFVRSHQRFAFAAMFAAAAYALKILAKDPKFIGGELPGFMGVLHTWGRTLEFHPHIHFIVSGGALSKDGSSWHPSRIDFYLPVKALSKIYRASFRDAAKRAGLFDAIDPAVWERNWNVNSQALNGTAPTLRYLAPYVFKVAISDSRIVAWENCTVTFRYRKPRSSRWRTVTLNAFEFIRRFLQHVLPSGFMKVRYYGFMSPNAAINRERLCALIELAYGFALPAPEEEIEPVPFPRCFRCGGRLVRYTVILAVPTSNTA